MKVIVITIFILLISVFLLLFIAAIRSEINHRNQAKTASKNKDFYRWD